MHLLQAQPGRGGRREAFKTIRIHTHRPHSSSFLGLPYRILDVNPKKELLWGLWVYTCNLYTILNYTILSPFSLPKPAVLPTILDYTILQYTIIYYIFDFPNGPLSQTAQEGTPEEAKFSRARSGGLANTKKSPSLPRERSRERLGFWVLDFRGFGV